MVHFVCAHSPPFKLQEFEMPSNLKYFAASIVFALSAAGPVLAATPSDNVGGSYGVRDANAPKATAEARAVASKARAAERRRVAAENLKNPVNNQSGQPTK